VRPRPQQNTLPSKRRGAALDAVPEAKRGAAARGGAAGTAAAAGAAGAAPAAGEETWDDIAARTGMTPEDLLNRKLVFKKGTLPAKKLEEMAPVIRELKCGAGAGGAWEGAVGGRSVPGRWVGGGRRLARTARWC
jgi:hypothetical protein